MRDKIETPHFDGSPTSNQIVKSAAKALQESLSYNTQAVELSEWSRRNVSRWPGAYAVTLDRKIWQRFVSSTAKYKPRQRSLSMLAWHWLFELHPYAITPLWRDATGDHSPVPNTLVPALHGFMSPGASPINMEALAYLKGEYAVYRPSYINLKNIMVMSMTCGMGDDPSRFIIEMASSLDEASKPEYVDGFAIPYRECILFQGRIRNTSAPFIFVMSGLPLNADGDGYERGDGTLLVGASGARSSAYPIAMRRRGEKMPVRTYAPKQFEALFSAHDKPMHKEIIDLFNRGIVGWQ